MGLRHVVVEVVPGGEGLTAELAGPEHRAREVNVLHVLLQVAALTAHSPAQPTPMALPISQLFYVRVQALQASYNRQEEQTITPMKMRTCFFFFLTNRRSIAIYTVYKYSYFVKFRKQIFTTI